MEQGSLADVPRLLQGFLRGLESARPALFAVFRDAGMLPEGLDIGAILGMVGG